jgi:hypothetical protein
MLAAVVVGALIVGAGVSWASIPDSGGVISACYNNTNGSLRVIDAEGGASCSGNETALNWEQFAPTVILSQQRVSSGAVQHTLSAGSGVGQTVSCPAGWEVTGGGYSLPDSAPVRVATSAPDATFPPGGPLLKTWAVRVVADSNTTFTLNVWAVCMAAAES